MILLLLLALFVSGWTLGLHLAAWDGGLLAPLRKALERIVGTYVSDPILSCPYCMPSLHGALFYVLYHLRHHLPFPPWHWALCEWLVLACLSSVINYLVYNLIRLLIAASTRAEEDPCSEVTGIQANIFHEKNEA